MPRPGETMPYRPMPSDFEEIYVRLGVNGAKAHYHAHFRTIARWIENSGGVELVNLRVAHLQRSGRQATINRVLSRKRHEARLMALAQTQCVEE